MCRRLAAFIGIVTTYFASGIALAASLALAEPPIVNDMAAISPTQEARLAVRLRLIDQIVRTVDADLRALENAGPRRQWVLESLYAMPLEKLQALGAPSNFSALRDAIGRANSARTPQKALGSSTEDLAYKPVTPCRFVDTRILGTKVSGSLSFDIGLNGNVYGGDVNCNITTLAGVPDNAIGAVAMNLTYFDTSTAAIPGFLGVRPIGSTNQTSVLNWNVSSPFAQDANTTVVAMDQSANTQEFEVFGSAGSEHVIIDIMGAFIAPGATALDCATVVTNGAGTVATGTTFPFPTPTACPVGYMGVAIACEYGPTPPAGLALTSVGAADVTTGFLTCLWRNESGSTLQGSDFHTHTRCCRVPGR